MHNNTNTSPASSSFPFAKFLPGLVLGVVVGAFAGAFFPPIAHAWATLPPDPVSHGPRDTTPILTASGSDQNAPSQAADTSITIGAAIEGH